MAEYQFVADFPYIAVLRTQQVGGIGEAQILAEVPGGDKHLTYILAYLPESKEFVTWLCNLSDGGGLYYGHYFNASDFPHARQAYDAALADLIKRM